MYLVRLKNFLLEETEYMKMLPDIICNEVRHFINKTAGYPVKYLDTRLSLTIKLTAIIRSMTLQKPPKYAGTAAWLVASRILTPDTSSDSVPSHIGTFLCTIILFVP